MECVYFMLKSTSKIDHWLAVWPCAAHLTLLSLWSKVKWSRSVVSNSLWPHGLQPTRLLCPCNSPGKNTGVGCHFLLQEIFPTQGLSPGLLPCRQMLYCLSQQGNLSLYFLIFKMSTTTKPVMGFCKIWLSVCKLSLQCVQFLVVADILENEPIAERKWKC